MCGYSDFSVATNVASEDIILDTTGLKYRHLYLSEWIGLLNSEKKRRSEENPLNKRQKKYCSQSCKFTTNHRDLKS